MNLFAEYVWLGEGIRSKNRVLAVPNESLGEDGSLNLAPNNIPVWGFDGSSTGQATTDGSDCVLIPCFVVRHPFVPNGILILCQVFDSDLNPHDSDYRAQLVKHLSDNSESLKEQQPAVGFEQEYVLEADGVPLGWPERGQPEPQGPYYCGNGHSRVRGRGTVERHLSACLAAGLSIGGTNAEVMLGQWEYQMGGPATPMITACDHLILSRFILERASEIDKVDVNWDPKPVSGDWNGSGLHVNFSTASMRSEGGMEEIEEFCKKLSSKDAMERHTSAYGEGLERRLTGTHETSNINEFTWGVSDRGASVRIPWSVSNAGFGHLEDRRPNSNANPYRVCLAMSQTLFKEDKKSATKKSTKKATTKKATTKDNSSSEESLA